MRRIRNRGVIYTGKVGAKMPMRAKRATRRIAKALHECRGGPFHGHKLCLSDMTSNTLPFVVNGVAGRYCGGRWEPSSSRVAA